MAVNYKIKGLSDEHPVQKEFDRYMHKVHTLKVSKPEEKEQVVGQPKVEELPLKRISTPAPHAPLKSCPFCGGEAYIHGNSASLWVSCKKCYAESISFETVTSLNAHQEATEWWNRRVVRTPEEIREMRLLLYNKMYKDDAGKLNEILNVLAWVLCEREEL